jgi:DNA-binding response OmpR family regulator
MAAAEARVLVVDDEPMVREVLSRYLEQSGFEVEAAADGERAMAAFDARRPDLVLLDLMLPRIDGFEVFRRIRARGGSPVIMITARGQTTDRIAGLDVGADDYVSKPFSPRELTARVKAVLRRARGPLAGALPPGPSRLVDADLLVDVAARQARLGDDLVALTSRELELLVFLMRHPQRAFRREELLQEVWGYSLGDTSTVTVHVRRLREKIEPDPTHPCRIGTVWGIGYRWEGLSSEREKAQ